MNNKIFTYLIFAIIGLCIVVFLVWFKRTQNVVENKPKDAKIVSNNIIEEKKDMNQAQGCVRNFDENKFKTEKVDIVGKKVEINVQNFGRIVLALDEKSAPKTVENFLKLTNAGFYDCLTFHRIAKGFVIQGGDPKGDGTGGPGFTVPAEIRLPHKTGSIAMARLSDQVNPKKESSGSQFYIALNDLAQLDGEYTVFGGVVEGMEVVKAISEVKINSGYGDGPPETSVIMNSVKIIK